MNHHNFDDLMRGVRARSDSILVRKKSADIGKRAKSLSDSESYDSVEIYDNEKLAFVEGSRRSQIMDFMKAEFVDSHLQAQNGRIGILKELDNFEIFHFRVEIMNADFEVKVEEFDPDLSDDSFSEFEEVRMEKVCDKKEIQGGKVKKLVEVFEKIFEQGKK